MVSPHKHITYKEQEQEFEKDQEQDTKDDQRYENTDNNDPWSHTTLRLCTCYEIKREREMLSHSIKYIHTIQKQNVQL